LSAYRSIESRSRNNLLQYRLSDRMTLLRYCAIAIAATMMTVMTTSNS
jgi:hypothetical protein